VALAQRGLRAIAGFAVPVEQLEQLDAILRAAPRQAGGAALVEHAFAPLGWTDDQAGQILRGLDFIRARDPAPDAPAIWRRRAPSRRPAAQSEASPFAALATLTPSPAPATRRARTRKPRKRADGR
jgi:ATP-dependent RNA helicase SUPV3L1/SUV3